MLDWMRARVDREAAEQAGASLGSQRGSHAPLAAEVRVMHLHAPGGSWGVYTPSVGAIFNELEEAVRVERSFVYIVLVFDCSVSVFYSEGWRRCQPSALPSNNSGIHDHTPVGDAGRFVWKLYYYVLHTCPLEVPFQQVVYSIPHPDRCATFILESTDTYIYIYITTNQLFQYYNYSTHMSLPSVIQLRNASVDAFQIATARAVSPSQCFTARLSMLSVAIMSLGGSACLKSRRPTMFKCVSVPPTIPRPRALP